MLGHKLYQRLPADMRVVGAARTVTDRLSALARPGGRIIPGLEASNFETAERILEEVRPDVVINCVGVIKQRDCGADAISSITANSLFPHQLAAESRAVGARLIHISTDCVFSGARGSYAESDPPDPVDLYGHTKLVGEVDEPEVLTIRTSMIGRELAGHHSLVEWFLRQRGIVRGYTKAVFSGLTTLALADEIARLIGDYPRLDGLYHVSADPITKHDLLLMLRDAFKIDCEIVADDSVRIDRSLNGVRYRDATGFVAVSWATMIAALASDNSAPLYRT
jgi:dTDP-4-dehydrorhamnose reductase